MICSLFAKIRKKLSWKNFLLYGIHSWPCHCCTSARKPHWVRLSTREEREAEQMQCCSILMVTHHVTCCMQKSMACGHYHFPVCCSAYESWSLGAQGAILCSRWVDPHRCIQVMEFQEYSAYVRQDATVMCLCMNCGISHLQWLAQWFEANRRKLLHMVIQHPELSVYISDATISCDSHRVIPKFIASIFVALIPMYRNCWLA